MMRVSHSALWKACLRAMSIGSFLACGGLAVTLVCIKNPTIILNRPSLIIQACAFITGGINQIVMLIISSRFLICISIVAHGVALASSISYTYTLIKGLQISQVSEISMHLIVAHLSLIFYSMLLGGTILASSVLAIKCPIEEEQDLENQPVIREHTDSKTVRLKNSAQTLTPEHDMEELMAKPLQNWMNNCPTIYSGSDTTSTPSVVKYNLEQQSVQKQYKDHDHSKTFRHKLAFSGKLAKSPKMEALKKIAKGKSSRNSSPEPPVSPLNETHVRYVTRLSTIQDNSRSFLNVLSNSQCAEETRKSLNSISLPENESKSVVDLDNSMLLMEKHAIDRINSALLPPSLRNNDTNKKSLNDNFKNNTLADIAVSNTNCDTLLVNDLQDIPQIPTWDENHEIPVANNNFLRSTSLKEWKSNGAQLLENERKLSASTSQLLPGFNFYANAQLQTKSEFSFPGTAKKSIPRHDMLENEHGDTVSELDVLFTENAIQFQKNEDETDIMQDVLKQDNSSPIIQKMSKDLTYRIDPHSPTKSITSIMSSSANNSVKSPSKLASIFSNGGSSSIANYYQHSRSNSQVTAAPYPASNYMNANYSVQSSPTKSNKLRRSLTKKISLSSISFKHDEHETSFNDCFHSSRHSRGQSIDFSYVHTLQSKHSPSKSLSTIGRRNSTINAGERGLRSVSALFFLQNEEESKSQQECNITLPDGELLEEKDQSSAISTSSKCSDISYPKKVFSEYDREKWSTILSLEKNGGIHPQHAL